MNYINSSVVLYYYCQYIFSFLYIPAREIPIWYYDCDINHKGAVS